MSLTVSVLTGQASPWTGQFDKDLVTIGRGPGADVRLHPSDSVCASNIHAHLVKSGDDWSVEVIHANGVTLQGLGDAPVRLNEGQRAVLPGESELVIGRSGPRLRVSLAARPKAQRPAHQDFTVRIISGHHSPWTGTFSKDQLTIGRSANADVRLHPTLDTACASDIHARVTNKGGNWFIEVIHLSGVTISQPGRKEYVLAPGQRFALEGDTDVTLGKGGPLIRLSPPMQGDFIPPTAWGDNAGAGTDMIAGVPTELVARASGRHFRKKVMIGAGGGMAVLLLAMVFLPGSGGGASDEARLRSALEQASSHVYAVGSMTPNGEFDSGCGTAWVVGDGLLATNGHVADCVESARSSGKKVIVRRPGIPPKDLTISSTKIHPGWKFGKTLDGKRFVSRTLSFTSFAPCFDVALIRVEGDTGEGLELADEDEILGLKSGQTVGYVGFPMENIVGLKENFSPTQSIAHVSSMTDVLGEVAAPEDSVLIQHTLTTVGGASGSPVLNAEGHVIGLVNAGNMLRTTSGRVSVGFNIAQRVDLLKELIDDTASSLQSARQQKLLVRLEEKLAPPEKIASFVANDTLASMKQSNANLRNATLNPFWNTSGTIHAGASNGIRSNVRLNQGSQYIVVACAKDFSNVDTRVLNGSQRVAVEEGEEVISVLTLSVQFGSSPEITIMVYANETMMEQPQVYIGVFLIEM